MWLQFYYWRPERKTVFCSTRSCYFAVWQREIKLWLHSPMFNVSSVAVMKLIKRESEIMPDPEIASSIKEVSFDEMWHFVEQKKTSYGSGGQWSAVEIGQSAGVLGIVLLNHSELFTKDLSIWMRCFILMTGNLMQK